MTETQELVRRLYPFSDNSLAKAGKLSRPSVADIKSGKTRPENIKSGTLEKLKAALAKPDELKPAPITPKTGRKAAPKRRIASAARSRGAASVGGKSGGAK